MQFVSHESRVCLVEGDPSVQRLLAEGSVLIIDIVTDKRSVTRKALCLPVRWSHDLGVWTTVPGEWLAEYQAEMERLDSEDHR